MDAIIELYGIRIQIMQNGETSTSAAIIESDLLKLSINEIESLQKEALELFNVKSKTNNI